MADLAEITPDVEASPKEGSAAYQVLTYLRTMEARDLDVGQSHVGVKLSHGFSGRLPFR